MNDFLIMIQNRTGFEAEVRRMYPDTADQKLERRGDDYANSTIQAFWLGWRLRGNFEILGTGTLR